MDIAKISIELYSARESCAKVEFKEMPGKAFTYRLKLRDERWEPQFEFYRVLRHTVYKGACPRCQKENANFQECAELEESEFDRLYKLIRIKMAFEKKR